MQLIRRAFRQRRTCRLQPRKPRSRGRWWGCLICTLAPSIQVPGPQTHATAENARGPPVHSQQRELNTVTRQVGYETRPQHIEERRREILQMIQTKKYKYCTLGLFLDEDNASKLEPPVSWKPRQIPTGVPIDTITL